MPIDLHASRIHRIADKLRWNYAEHIGYGHKENPAQKPPFILDEVFVKFIERLNGGLHGRTLQVAKLVRFAQGMMNRNRYYIIFRVLRYVKPLLCVVTISLAACHVSSEVEKQGELDSRHVDLSRRDLNSIPSELAQKQQIEKLILFRNQIDTLPAFIGGMDSLKKLSLKSNKLVYLDSNAMDLPSLKELDLRFNRLENIPDAFTGMLDLEVLDLRNNRLKSLPASIGAMKNLEQLYLADNDIRTLPSTMQGLKKLKFLIIGRNSIEDRLPDWIGEMESLVELDVAGCCNDNRLPDNLSKLRHLELLTVSPYQVLPNDLGKGNSRMRIQIK